MDSKVAELWQIPAQQSLVGMAKVALDGRLFAVNRTFCEMLGRSEEEMTAGTFQDLTHPDDVDRDVASLQQMITGEHDSYRVRKRYLHADGSTVWADLVVTLLHDDTGEPLHFITQILDITEQHAYEERLKTMSTEVERERQILEAIFEAVRVGLVLIGPDGQYLRMNRRHAELLDLTHPGERHLWGGIPGHVYATDGRTPLTREELPTYLAMQGEEFDDLATWAGADVASRRAVIASARTVRAPSGERVGAALAFHDVTELMRAMQVRDDFVASVSHELRTPLTSVLGYLEMLAESPDLSDDLRAQVHVVRRNALRLQGLVSDLLEVGEYAEAGLTLQRESVDVARVAREAFEATRPLAEGNGVELAADLPVQLVADIDGERIRQVLDNLLSNGVKYSRTGDAVRLVVRQVGRTIELEVSDTGVGIAQEELPLVFDRFYRSSSARADQISGTGLGLDIVRTIVEAHDGTISVRSALGEGTTFLVCLPAG